MRRLLDRLRRAVRSDGRVALKLAAYTVVCLLVLGWLVSAVGNTAFFTDRTGYEAELDDATGLRVNDAVKSAGVEVGSVASHEGYRTAGVNPSPVTGRRSPPPLGGWDGVNLVVIGGGGWGVGGCVGFGRVC